MSLIPLIASAVVLSMSTPAFAQEWTPYVNREDGFSVDFPGQPRVQATTWKSQYDFILPARVYSAERGRERYSITVVDYNGVEQQGMERSKKCPSGAETCQGQTAGYLLNIIGPAYSKADIRGALLYATFLFVQRDAKVTLLMQNFTDLVDGHLVQLTNNADQSRTFAAIHMHENKLYIQEGTVPKGYPEPGLFQQSMGFVDKDGNGIRYQTVYSNEFHGLRVYPPPPLYRGGRPDLNPAGPAGAGPAGSGGGGR